MGKIVVKNTAGPVKGLNTKLPPSALNSTWAITLQNFLCRPGGLVVRDGSKLVSQLNAATINPPRLIPYNAGAVGGSTLFVATDSGIYNVFSGLLSTAAINVPTVCWLNFANGAGEYLFVFNGTQNAQMWNGAVWAATAWGGGVNNAHLAQAVAYRKRIYAIETFLRGFWYLAPDAIGGVATFFNVGSLLSRGGTPVALATWSIDGGAGPDDYLALATDAGEVVIFNGNDPGAADWKVIGTFYIGRPASRDCFVKYGGDLLFLCEFGCFPMSKALKSADINRSESITDSINPTIGSYISEIIQAGGSLAGALPPYLRFYTSKSLVAIILPATFTKPAITFVMDPQAGGWSSVTGVPQLECLDFGGYLYAAGVDVLLWNGKVSIYKVLQPGAGSVEALATSAWFAPAVTMVTGYDRFSSINPLQPLEIRPFFNSQVQYPYTIGWAQDYRDSYVLQSMSVDQSNWAIIGTSTWGTSAVWASSDKISNPWMTLAGRAGYAQSLQWASNLKYFADTPPTLVGFDLRFAEQGTGGP